LTANDPVRHPPLLAKGVFERTDVEVFRRVNAKDDTTAITAIEQPRGMRETEGQGIQPPASGWRDRHRRCRFDAEANTSADTGGSRLRFAARRIIVAVRALTAPPPEPPRGPRPRTMERAARPSILTGGRTS